MSYQFRRQDNDEIIDVDFETMIEQDAAGFIEIEIDGQKVSAKRVHTKEKLQASKPIPMEIPPAIVSDSFGCVAEQVDEMRAQCKLHGLTGVEFKPDPTNDDPRDPDFFQAHFSGPAELSRYRDLMNVHERNSTNGGAQHISESDLAQSQAIIKRRFGAFQPAKKSLANKS